MELKKNNGATSASKFVDDDEDWGSFRLPTKEELSASKEKPKQDSLYSRIDALRDRLAQE